MNCRTALGDGGVGQGCSGDWPEVCGWPWRGSGQGSATPLGDETCPLRVRVWSGPHPEDGAELYGSWSRNTGEGIGLRDRMWENVQSDVRNSVLGVTPGCVEGGAGVKAPLGSCGHRASGSPCSMPGTLSSPSKARPSGTAFLGVAFRPRRAGTGMVSCDVWVDEGGKCTEEGQLGGCALVTGTEGLSQGRAWE